jgi:hypothetical protein
MLTVTTCLVIILAFMVGAGIAVMVCDMRYRKADKVEREKALADLRGMLTSFEKAHNDLAYGLKSMDDRVSFLMAQKVGAPGASAARPKGAV